jgi:hypothetical protein
MFRCQGSRPFVSTFFFAGAMVLVSVIPLAGCGSAEAGDGEGGAGGDVLDGTTGSGKNANVAGSTGTGFSTSATGQGGAANTCVGPDGRGFSVASCDMTNIGSLATCPDSNVPPVGLEVCQLAHELYTQGSWENLLSCLGELPATYDEACVEPMASENVSACIAEVVAEACPNPTADALCASIETACTEAGRSFELGACKETLAPYNDETIAAYDDCIRRSAPSIACEDLHGSCVTTL